MKGITRALLLSAATQACSHDSTISVTVDTTSTGVFYYLTDTACPCSMYGRWPDENGCVITTDAGMGCACHPGSCLVAIRAERDGQVLASTDLDPAADNEVGGLVADLTQHDTELILEGCNDTLTVALPSSFPPAPVITNQQATGNQTHVEWAAEPGLAYLVDGANLTGNTICRTSLGAGMFDVPASVWASSGDHPYF